MELSAAAKRYIAAVIAAGAVALGGAVLAEARSAHPWPPALVGLVLLAAMAEFLQATVFRDRVGLSTYSIILLATLAIAGVPAAVLLAVVPGLAYLRLGSVKWAFNTAMFAIGAAAAGGAYVGLGGPVGGFHGFSWRDVLAFLAADVAFLVVNGVLVARVVAYAQELPVKAVVATTLAPTAITYLGNGLFGLLLAVLWLDAGLGPVAALLILLPLYLAYWAYSQFSGEQLAHERTIATLIQAVETKDLYTRGHNERVAKAVVIIGRQLRMPEERVETLRYAGTLHDVGKLAVPTRVLQKEGRLTDEEFETIKMHPLRGLEVVRDIEFLDEAFRGILHHHERMDGRGYPMGLAGGAIPEFARVIAVADAFDSMTSTRSYRSARGVPEALAELQECAGTQFDPRMVDALVAGVQRVGWTPQTGRPYVPGDPAGTGEVLYDHDDPAYARMFTRDLPDAPAVPSAGPPAEDDPDPRVPER
ncbi:MAG: HD-GYP domain-containing protein [Actinomycetes bacterium]